MKNSCVKLLRPMAAIAASAVCLLVSEAQNLTAALPTVVAMDVPTYPDAARVAHLEGSVHLRVTTDGNHVIAIDAEDGPQLLAVAAERNVRSWHLSPHRGVTFTVTYHYAIAPPPQGDLRPPAVTLRMPIQVDVTAAPYQESVQPPTKEKVSGRVPQVFLFNCPVPEASLVFVCWHVAKATAVRLSSIIALDQQFNRTGVPPVVSEVESASSRFLRG